MIRKIAIPLAVLCLVSGCSTYQYAKNVKLISFDNNAAAGKGVGPVRGENCQAFVMGYAISDAPTLDQAVADARSKNKVRYLNNVATENTGFNAVVFAKRCIVVRGTGYE